MNVRMVDAARRHDPRSRRARAWSSTSTEPPGKGDRFVIDLVKNVEGAGVPDPQQDRSDQEVEAAADHGAVQPRWGRSPRSSRCRRRPATTSIGWSARSSTGCPKASRCYPPDYLTDQPERFFAAEIVREKLLQFTHAEIPFSSAVVDRPVRGAGAAERPLLQLYCTIVVDRESQKPIIVGRGGDMIKRIGIAAREDLERFFDDAGVSRPARPREVGVARGRRRAERHRVWTCSIGLGNESLAD